MIVGREKELKKTTASLERGQNMLLTGEGGIGKSKILENIAAERGDKVHYIPLLSPPESVLKETYSAIGDFTDDELRKRKFSQWKLNRLTKEIIALVEGCDFVLCIDSMEKLTASSSEWLRTLAESNITILGACREPKTDGPLDRFFATFQLIQLKQMSDDDIKEIVRQEIFPEGKSEPVICFSNRDAKIDFVEHVVKSAKGIPATAVEMCHRAARVDEVSINFIREHLIDDQESLVKWIDASKIMLIGLAAIIFLRYFARVTGDLEAYLIFSPLPTIAFLMWRFFPKSGK